jgi:hypothetical protein
VSVQAAILTALSPCGSCDPARCDHARTWWCAGCGRWETCDTPCPEDLSGGTLEDER